MEASRRSSQNTSLLGNARAKSDFIDRLYGHVDHRHVSSLTEQAFSNVPVHGLDSRRLTTMLRSPLATPAASLAPLRLH
jgi:hypothetical protein